MLILDSGGISFLARRNTDALATIRAFRQNGLWPPVVPSAVLTETTTGRQRDDANTNRLLKTCDLVEELPASLARRAGELRYRARRGSAIDAILVATAEPGGVILTGDVDDLTALASDAERVDILGIRPTRR